MAQSGMHSKQRPPKCACNISCPRSQSDSTTLSTLIRGVLTSTVADLKYHIVSTELGEPCGLEINTVPRKEQGGTVNALVTKAYLECSLTPQQ
jgi:hypothetical protein